MNKHQNSAGSIVFVLGGGVLEKLPGAARGCPDVIPVFVAYFIQVYI